MDAARIRRGRAASPRCAHGLWATATRRGMRGAVLGRFFRRISTGASPRAATASQRTRNGPGAVTWVFELVFCWCGSVSEGQSSIVAAILVGYV